MLKDATYKDKCNLLNSWMPIIIDTVKKDLKNEHLKNDPKFVKKYLTGKNLNKLTTEDIVTAYSTALEQDEKAEEMAEFITNRWLFKNSELYDYFEKALSKISPHFTELTEIDLDKSQKMIEESITHFGASRTYLFSVMNSVVFPKEIFEKLNKLAHEEQKHLEHKEAIQKKQMLSESLKEHYEEQIARMTDKYEKKLSAMERKYFQDTESLKKQIVVLQKKIQA